MLLTESPRRDSTAKRVDRDHLATINIEIASGSGITMKIAIRKDKSNQSLV